MRVGHDLVPRLRRQRAAGHAIERTIIVVAVPHAAHEVASVADEPGVAIGVGGAVLPADLMPSRIARLAVPSSTTLLIMKAMSEATWEGIA